MCEFTHLLATIQDKSKLTIQDALDEGLSDNVDFLVQENGEKQEKKLSIEPDDGYEMDRGHDDKI